MDILDSSQSMYSDIRKRVSHSKVYLFLISLTSRVNLAIYLLIKLTMQIPLEKSDTTRTVTFTIFTIFFYHFIIVLLIYIDIQFGHAYKSQKNVYIVYIFIFDFLLYILFINYLYLILLFSANFYECKKKFYVPLAPTI